MTRRREVRSKAIPELPQLNLEEFTALTDVLYEALSGNVSAVCKLLGISRPTWKRWEQTPPDWPHWNLVLRYVIKHTLAGMIGRRRSPAAKHKQYVRDALARVPNSSTLTEEILSLAYETREAEEYLRTRLIRGGLRWKEIRRGSNFSPTTLRKAARTLGVVKEHKGFGKDKKTYWRLPDAYEE